VEVLYIRSIDIYRDLNLDINDNNCPASDVVSYSPSSMSQAGELSGIDHQTKRGGRNSKFTASKVGTCVDWTWDACPFIVCSKCVRGLRMWLCALLLASIQLALYSK
jgi:hypothetical protein